MEDKRFDSLTKALASGANRRSVLKGLLGIGAATATGGVLLDDGAEAARRPTPTPKPVTCPGQQTWNGTKCECPDGLSQCNPGTGPACCNDQHVDPGEPGYSTCCDNACCQGTCYNEELCCATNSRPGEQPPTNRICETNDGPECCLYSDACCTIDGCCATTCSGGNDGVSYCCSAGDACPGGSTSPDLCCQGDTVCCGPNTNGNVCADLSDDDTNCGACGNECPGCTTCQDGVCRPDNDLCLACETCQQDPRTTRYVCVNDCTGCAECQASQLNPAGNCFPIDIDCLSCQVCELNDTDTGGTCVDNCGGCGACVSDPLSDPFCAPDNTLCPPGFPDRVCCADGEGGFGCEDGEFCGCDNNDQCSQFTNLAECQVGICDLGNCDTEPAPEGTVCHAAGASAICDPQVTCSGESQSCPGPDYAPVDTDCGDCLECNGTGLCLPTCGVEEDCCPGLTDKCVPDGATCCTEDAECAGCERCNLEGGYCISGCTGDNTCCTEGGTEECCPLGLCVEGAGCCPGEDICGSVCCGADEICCNGTYCISDGLHCCDSDTDCSELDDCSNDVQHHFTCDVDGGFCVDTATDCPFIDDCTSVGCNDSGNACNTVSFCINDEICCGGPDCVDSNSDPNNCGDCGIVCDDPPVCYVGPGSCVDASCIYRPLEEGTPCGDCLECDGFGACVSIGTVCGPECCAGETPNCCTDHCVAGSECCDASECTALPDLCYSADCTEGICVYTDTCAGECCAVTGNCCQEGTHCDANGVCVDDCIPVEPCSGDGDCCGDNVCCPDPETGSTCVTPDSGCANCLETCGGDSSKCCCYHPENGNYDCANRTGCDNGAGHYCIT